MPSSLVDLHCHLDLYPDFESLVEECEALKIYTLAITTTPVAWPKNYELTRLKKYVRAALGMHPQLIAKRVADIPIFEQYFPQARYIGEIGLDAGPKFYTSFDLQKEVFGHILNLCVKHGQKILSIHSVRSTTHVLNFIEKIQVSIDNKIVLHWFSGTLKEAIKAVELGCFFSVNMEMLNNPKNYQTIRSIPINRILTETDGPFIKINSISQKPKDVILAVEKMSDILNWTIEGTRSQILANLFELVSI